MKMREIAMKVIKKERGKKRLNIGDINEVLGIVSDLCATNSSVVSTLIKNGERRKRLRSRKK